MGKLYIIGNGFDVAHELPTKFDPDFKRIAKRIENSYFWELYQSQEDDIWSDFENLLGCPDYNELEGIFDGYEPDYLSDRESDRDGIIFQAEFSGNLNSALYEFANNAENSLTGLKKIPDIDKLLDEDAYYISFNYTHTLEKIYNIPTDNVLHIHGEVGADNLALGYPKGNYTPEKYSYDPRQKGTGPYVQIGIEDYINEIEDYYIRTAFKTLVEKCKSFYKEIRTDLLKSFLDDNGCAIDEIIVYGHSCAIDFDYFDFINKRYPTANWTFYVKSKEQKNNTEHLIAAFGISNACVVDL